MKNYLVTYIPDLVTLKNENCLMQNWVVKSTNELEAFKIVAKKQLYLKEDWFECQEMSFDEVQRNLYERGIFFWVQYAENYMEEFEKNIARIHEYYNKMLEL